MRLAGSRLREERGAAGGRETTWAYFTGTGGDAMTETMPDGNAAGGTPADYTDTTVMDTFGRTFQSSEPSPTGGVGPTVTMGYDPDGNETSMTDPDGNTTDFSYNNLNEQISQTAPSPDGTTPGGVTTWGYNGAGDMTSMTDPLGNVSGGNSTANTTVYTYNAWDELTSESQPWPESGTGPYARPMTSYTYDDMGNQTSVKDPVGNLTSYGFNQRNQVTSMTGPAVVAGTLPVTKYTYDADGNLKETDTPDGNKIIDTYDDDDRLTGQLLNNSSGSNTGSVSYTYDSDSRLSAVTGGNNGVDEDASYTFDDDNRLTAVDDTIEAAGTSYRYGLSQSFDADGNRLSLKASVNLTADLSDTFGYNNIDELTSETQQGQTGGNAVAAEGVKLAYDADGQVTSMQRYADASLTNASPGSLFYTFDHDQRLTNISSGATIPTTAVATFGYNADNWVTSYSLSGAVGVDGSRTYTDDNDGELTAATPGFGSGLASEAYTYDLAGNRTSATTGINHVSGITPGSGNRIANDGVNTYTFDADGNRTSTNNGAGSVTAFGYNALDQLVSSTQTSFGTTVQTATFGYDPVTAQRLYESVTTGMTTATQFFIYDPTTGNNLLVLNGSGQVIERDLPGLGMNQVLAVNTGMTGSGAGTVYWLTTDNVGSVIQVTDNSDTLVDNITYDTFGNITYQSNSSTGVRYGFAGMTIDPATGMLYDDRRYYYAPDGTFVTQDPTGFGSEDYNLYRYVGGDPGTYYDATGLDAPVGALTATGEVILEEGAAGSRLGPIGAGCGLAIGLFGGGYIFYEYHTAEKLNAQARVPLRVVPANPIPPIPVPKIVAPPVAPIPPANPPQLKLAPKGGSQAKPVPLVPPVPPITPPKDDKPRPKDDGFIEYLPVETFANIPSGNGSTVALNRATGAVAYITPEYKREHVGTPAFYTPMGWGYCVSSVRTRGHLIAKSFGGSGREPGNIVIQSAISNIEMGSYTASISTFVDEGDSVFMYVWPVYKGDNPVPTEVDIIVYDDFGLYDGTIERFKNTVPNTWGLGRRSQ